jgi:hypothetical protein
MAIRTVEEDEEVSSGIKCTPWKYINPPFEEGQAYLTTEYIDGAPVYKKYQNEKFWITAKTDSSGAPKDWLDELAALEGVHKNEVITLQQIKYDDPADKVTNFPNEDKFEDALYKENDTTTIISNMSSGENK